MKPRDYYFSLPHTGRPLNARLTEKRVPDYQWFDANRSRSRGGHPLNRVTTVVIHATAGWATQHALDNWRLRRASAHWIIPDEDEPQHGQFVWAVVSESLAAFHVKDVLSHADLGGMPLVNNFSLGVEIVNSQDVQQYQDPYSAWQIEQAAQIVRHCWSKYPNLKHVISHARIDPADRADPGTNFPWEEFKALVLSGRADPGLSVLASTLRPVSDFPTLDAANRGGCCP